jgi:hypothetical protein
MSLPQTPHSPLAQQTSPPAQSQTPPQSIQQQLEARRVHGNALLLEEAAAMLAVNTQNKESRPLKTKQSYGGYQLEYLVFCVVLTLVLVQDQRVL